MIRMKALKRFRGRPSEGVNGLVRPGREFRVESQHRARDLEMNGLAVTIKEMGKPLNKAEPLPKNKAADRGPLAPTDGGETGEVSPASSSPVARQRGRRRSKASEESAELSPSTTVGGSPDGVTSPTPVTGRGGRTGRGSLNTED